jgi:hypothetical protein
MACEIIFIYRPKTGEFSSHNENLMMGKGHVSKSPRILYVNWKSGLGPKQWQ